MKLKFEADPKDYIIFVIFCIALLYFVAIAVLNISTFANTQHFWGFNPFPAFSSKFIAPTLIGFFGALIAIMMSVSSMFFDREEGIGFSFNRKNKGYARWSTTGEMKRQLKPVIPFIEKSSAGGVPLINNGKKIWVDNGEYHSLVIGSTGSGKTEMIVLPLVKTLAKNEESMIVTDPKGEIYENNANMLREKGYNIILLNFRDPQKGNAWNPLSLPYSLYTSGNKDKANELVDDLAVNILYDEAAQGQDPFWEKTSADYFAGLCLALFNDAKETEINLNSVNLMTTVGEEKCGNSTYMKEYFSYKDKASPEYIDVASTIMAPSDTKASILSVFKQKIKLFSSRENLSEMLARSDFDMKDIGRKKTAVFIVVQDEKKTYHSLVTIFIKQCYESLIDVAQECGGKLPHRTNFILDEFANMPPLKDVTTMVTAARSRKIRFTFIIQNFAQLNQVYGKENAETIKGNCGNIVYLISSEMAALEEISKMCGEEKSKEKDKTVSTPLVTVSDLQRLPMWTTVIVRTRMMPYKTILTPNWKMEKNNYWGKKYDLATYPARDKKAIEMFDIKEYVDKKRDDKISQMLGTGNTESSSGGISPFMAENGLPVMRYNFDEMAKPQKNANEFNVDDLVKRIDAKIAELEEEEKNEKNKSDVKQVAVDEMAFKEKDNKNMLDDIRVKNRSYIEKDIPKTKTEVKPVHDKENSSMPLEPIQDDEIDTQLVQEDWASDEQLLPSSVTDDQFFDDFFSDDE